MWTGDEAYPIYIPGSATLLKYKGRYFMVCTRHQLKQDENFADVCLMIPYEGGRTECITSGGARWIDGLNDGDHEQIVIFDFTQPCTDKPELKPMFFDFRRQHPDIRADKIVAFISFGYPTDHTKVDYENGQIRQAKMRVLSSLATPGTDDALHILDTIEPLDFDPDGMSGGPTFCLVMDGPEGFSVHLAGITVRGGKNTLMVIKAGAVQAMLNIVIRDRLP